MLDHIFLSKAVTDYQYEVVHLNAEFAGQASDHDPQVVRIRPSVRQGTLTLDPASVVVGAASTTVRLSGWYPNRQFTIKLDGTTVGTVTTDASGAAPFTVPLAPGITVGAHLVTATTADGATATATLTVKPVPVTIGSVFATPSTVKAGKQVAPPRRLVAVGDPDRVARRDDPRGDHPDRDGRHGQRQGGGPGVDAGRLAPANHHGDRRTDGDGAD